jgi:thiamine pyrophosphokinase
VPHHETFVDPAPDVGTRRRALVLSGGAALVADGDLAVPGEFADALVVAADAGASAARSLGRTVDVLVGDLDSIDAAVLAALADTTEIEQHPADKDATDLELAIAVAVERGAEEICVVDAARGRLDHFVATLLLLSSPRWHGVVLRAVVDGAHVVVVPPGERRTIPAAVGATVSLIAVAGARGVTTDGLHYRLDDAELAVGTTLGVSNVVVALDASVHVVDGTVLVVVPVPEEQSR